MTGSLRNRHLVAVAVFAMIAVFTLAAVAAPAVDSKASASSSRNEAVSKPRDNTQRKSSHRRLTFIDVFFLTPERGFAAGSGGILFSTTDGGRNWDKRTIGDDDLRQIYFQDGGARGWILTDTGILRTDDAGETWTPSAPPEPRAVRRIYFVNPQVGWLLGGTGLIFKTTDGGKTWRRQSSGVKENLRKIACFTARSCIVAGERNTLLNTSNGGQTWIKRSPKIARYFDINAVQVTDAGTAWALAVTYKTAYLLQSRNRGRTWEIASRTLDENSRLIHFFDGRRGVLLDAIAISYTEDGGSTWNDGWPGGPLLNSFFFLNDKLAWAVGDFETILHTEDGGKTWVKQHDDGVVPVPHDR
jgi:photosystem II stability/assembly factor-like uncharacterized protein